MIEIKINDNNKGQRLDKLLLKYLNQAPSSFIYKMLRKKNIVLNDKKASGNEILSTGDLIKVYLSDDTISKFTKEKDSLKNVNSKSYPVPKVIYEDNDLLIVYKDAGILSQKADNNDLSMNEICLSYVLKNGSVSLDSFNIYTPSICNRLDRNTEGLLLFAKNYKMANFLSLLLKERTIQKYYYCIVKGIVTNSGMIEGYISKNESNNRVNISTEKTSNSSEIKTYIKPIKHVNNVSLLEIELITGKTHQIRAHLSSIGHPIIGDPKYGDLKLNQQYKKFGVTHQLLMAHKVIFPHIDDEFTSLSEKIIDIDMPRIYKEILNVNLE